MEEAWLARCMEIHNQVHHLRYRDVETVSGGYLVSGQLDFTCVMHLHVTCLLHLLSSIRFG